MSSVFSGRLLGKFLLWLVPSFFLVSAAGIYLVVEHDMRRETEAIVARVGNHAGRVAASLARNDITANTDIGYDLMSSLLADRAVQHRMECWAYDLGVPGHASEGEIEELHRRLAA